jgi:acyl-ACP thioesterase
MFPDSDYSDVYEQVIRSSNLDMLHHLNNTEYVKFALNVFPETFLLEHEIEEIEVHYKAECKENQTLRIMRKDVGNTVYIRIKESERCVSDLKICFAC